MWRWLALSAWALAGASGCKVPISGVDARFRIADASWFEDEQTLFVFYDVEAAQGISEDSVLEIRYETDDGAVDVLVRLEANAAARAFRVTVRSPSPAAAAAFKNVLQALLTSYFAV